MSFSLSVLSGLCSCWSLVLLAETVQGAQPQNVDAWEPLDAEYWGQGVADGAPFSVPTFEATNLSRLRFDELVTAGRVFVVRGVGALGEHGHPMRGWSCDYFEKDKVFKSVQVKREYSDPSKSDASPAWLSLADMKAAGTLDGASGASPYYLGIKDAAGMSAEELRADPGASETWSRRVLKKVQQHTSAPSFMDAENLAYLKNTPEFWFSYGVSGGGAKAHVDQHTESTMSLQLSGTKAWRVAPIGRRAAPHVMKLYGDGQVYSREEQHHWNILADVSLAPGDAIFFGPGLIHQTQAEPGACAASVTWQFNTPRPTTLWRSFLPRLRRTPDLVHTWELLRSVVLHPGADADGDGTLDAGEIRKATNPEFAKVAAAFLDIDGDGRVDVKECAQIRSIWDALEQQFEDELPKQLRQKKFGSDRVVEDADHLRSFPSVFRQTVQTWEAEALGRDAAAGTAAAAPMASGSATHGEL